MHVPTPYLRRASGHDVPPRRRQPQPQSRFDDPILHRILHKTWSLAFFALACLGLYEANCIADILHAADAHRAFVHAAVEFGTLVGVFGGYIEAYRSLLRGERVHYATATTATHGMLVSIVASGISYVAASRPLRVETREG